jgi:hypothetical protein
MQPDPLNGVRLGGMGRLKHQDYIGGNPQALGSMAPCLVELENQYAVLELLSYQIQEDLKAIRIEVGEFINEVLSGCWLDYSIEVGCLELPLHFALGFDPSECNFATADGLESNPGFIFTKESYWPSQSHHRDRHPSQHG